MNSKLFVIFLNIACQVIRDDKAFNLCIGTLNPIGVTLTPTFTLFLHNISNLLKGITFVILTLTNLVNDKDKSNKIIYNINTNFVKCDASFTLILRKYT